MHSWSCDHMYKIWPLTEELPSRHDVVLQAGADERPGVLHISWAGNEYLTMPFFYHHHQLFDSFLKLLKSIILQKPLLVPKASLIFTRAKQQRCLAECKVCPLPPSPGSTSTATCSSRWPILATSLLYHLVIPVFFPRYPISLSKVSYSPRVHSVAHMLLVTEAQGGDAGQYRCTARNEVPDLYF